MNQREPQAERVVAEISLEGCPEGPVLNPLGPRDEVGTRFFSGWQTPLAPWGGFKGGSSTDSPGNVDPWSRAPPGAD